MHQHLPHPRRGLDRVSTSDSQSSPHGRPPQHTAANRTQPKTAEYQGSLIIADQSHSRAHIDSSVHLVPNPISASDSRISPRKQAVRQADTIRINPETAEYQYFRNPVNQEHSRFHSHARIESDFRVRFPNQSAETDGPADGLNPHSSENGGIPRSPDHDQPAAKPATAPKPNQNRSRRPISEPVPGTAAPAVNNHNPCNRKQQNTKVL